MSEPGDLSPERVAELEKQLSDAAAQVAKVQAELAQAKAGEANGVPYGEPVAPTGQEPQSVDLTAILGPAMAQQVRDQLSQLGQFGIDSKVADLLGVWSGPAEPTMAPAVERLAEPPRQVPFSFKVSALFALNVWELFTILMVLVSPIAVWILVPWTVPVLFVVLVVVVVALRAHRYVRRVGVLRWGKVARVTNADEISRGTYFSGTTYQNIRLRQATGWDTTTRWYSGPGSKSTINYSVDDTDGTLTLRGLPYANGVILADPRKPNRAYCVSSFPFSVKPDANGEYVDHGLSPWAWLGIGLTVTVYAALIAGAWYAVDGLWLDLPG